MSRLPLVRRALPRLSLLLVTMMRQQLMLLLSHQKYLLPELLLPELLLPELPPPGMLHAQRPRRRRCSWKHRPP
jgi:hypothetical protein